MSDTNGKNGLNTSSTVMIDLPVWAVIIVVIVVIAFFFVTLTPNPYDVALLHTVGMTATQRAYEIVSKQAESTLNEQRTATEAARVTATPTITPTPLATSTPTPTETPALGVGSFKISDLDGMKMLYVPAGSFPMGLDSKDIQNGPVHEVYLDSYWIDQTEISNEMYATCVAAGKCTEPTSSRAANRREYYGNPTYYNFPVIYISWFQATEYCEWADRHLPSEAQWEKAARGEDGRLYPWGDEVDENKGNLWALKFATTVVGGYPGGVSPYGALNMSGNVFEWVTDWYDENYYQTQETSPNPTGPSEGEMRSLRGGLFRTEEKKESQNSFLWFADSESANQVLVNFLSGYRMRWNPEKSNILIGFRCAANAQ